MNSCDLTFVKKLLDLCIPTECSERSIYEFILDTVVADRVLSLVFGRVLGTALARKIELASFWGLGISNLAY